MLYDKNVRDGQRNAAKEHSYGWRSTTAVTPRQLPGQLLKVNREHNGKMNISDTHF